MPGPSAEQIQKLCEAMEEGLSKKHYGAQDGELLATLLGHFAWLSAGCAHDVIAFGGAAALVAWMRAPRFTKPRNPDDTSLAYPMQRACLTALSCLCRHDEECAFAVLALEVAPLAVDLTGHSDLGVRRAALRCLARLVPRAGKRLLRQERLPVERVWPVVLRELREVDEPSRTAAAACALEAVCDGWVSAETAPPVAELSEALLEALELAGPAAAAALPVLLAVGQLLGSESEAAAQALHEHEGFVQLLAAWLPRVALAESGAADRAAGTAAAAALCRLTERGAPLGARELGALLRHRASEHAEPAFREACDGAFSNAVALERDTAILAQLLATRVEEAGCLGEAPQTVARRILDLLKGSQDHHATESLCAALDRVEALIPRDTGEGASKDASLLLRLVMEARSLCSHDGAAESDRSSAGKAQDHTPLATTSTLPPLGQAGRSPDAALDFARTSPAIFAR